MITVEDILKEYRFWANYRQKLDNESYEWEEVKKIIEIYTKLIDQMIHYERTYQRFPTDTK